MIKIMPKVKRFSWFSTYKWELLGDWEYWTDITGHYVRTEYVTLLKNGTLKFKKGYRWDGASGPTWDTLSCRRGALVHDGLYQLLRTGKFPQRYKRTADQLLHDLCIEDGMWRIRAWLWLKGVEQFGHNSCKPEVA